MSKIRRYVRWIFNKESGREWQADLWAMCAFMFIAKSCGCQHDLKSFTNHHPEKLPVMALAALAVAYGGIKARFNRFSRLILLPFRLI